MGYNWENYEIGEGDLTLKASSDESAVDVGACENAELNLDPKIVDLKTGQVFGTIKKIKIDQKLTFAITLLEATFRNLVIALGGDPDDIVIGVDPDLFDTYKIKAVSVQALEEFELEYKVPCLYNKALFWTWTAKRAQNDGKLKYTFDNETPRTARVEFELLPDSADDDTQLTIKLDKTA